MERSAVCDALKAPSSLSTTAKMSKNGCKGEQKSVTRIEKFCFRSGTNDSSLNELYRSQLQLKTSASRCADQQRETITRTMAPWRRRETVENKPFRDGSYCKRIWVGKRTVKQGE